MAAIGQAAGGEGQAQGGDAAQGGQQQADGLGQLAEQLGQFGGSLEEMRQSLQALQPQQAAEQQGEQIDMSWLDGDMGQQLDQFGQPVVDQAALEQRNQAMLAAIDQRAQALVQPVADKLEEQRRNNEARDLGNEFPELKTNEMAQFIAGRGGLAEQAAHAFGQPHLAAEPAFWRLVYMAHKASDLANQQGSGDAGAAHLEGGGGPGPAQLSEADLVKQISQSGDGLGAGVLNFG